MRRGTGLRVDVSVRLRRLGQGLLCTQGKPKTSFLDYAHMKVPRARTTLSGEASVEVNISHNVAAPFNPHVTLPAHAVHANNPNNPNDPNSANTPGNVTVSSVSSSNAPVPSGFTPRGPSNSVNNISHRMAPQSRPRRIITKPSKPIQTGITAVKVDNIDKIGDSDNLDVTDNDALDAASLAAQASQVSAVSAVSAVSQGSGMTFDQANPSLAFSPRYQSGNYSAHPNIDHNIKMQGFPAFDNNLVLTAVGSGSGSNDSKPLSPIKPNSPLMPPMMSPGSDDLGPVSPQSSAEPLELNAVQSQQAQQTQKSKKHPHRLEGRHTAPTAARMQINIPEDALNRKGAKTGTKANKGTKGAKGGKAAKGGKGAKAGKKHANSANNDNEDKKDAKEQNVHKRHEYNVRPEPKVASGRMDVTRRHHADPNDPASKSGNAAATLQISQSWTHPAPSPSLSNISEADTPPNGGDRGVSQEGHITTITTLNGERKGDVHKRVQTPANVNMYGKGKREHFEIGQTGPSKKKTKNGNIPIKTPGVGSLDNLNESDATGVDSEHPEAPGTQEKDGKSKNKKKGKKKGKKKKKKSKTKKDSKKKQKKKRKKKRSKKDKKKSKTEKTTSLNPNVTSNSLSVTKGHTGSAGANEVKVKSPKTSKPKVTDSNSLKVDQSEGKLLKQRSWNLGIGSFLRSGKKKDSKHKKDGKKKDKNKDKEKNKDKDEGSSKKHVHKHSKPDKKAARPRFLSHSRDTSDLPEVQGRTQKSHSVTITPTPDANALKPKETHLEPLKNPANDIEIVSSDNEDAAATDVTNAANATNTANVANASNTANAGEPGAATALADQPSDRLPDAKAVNSNNSVKSTASRPRARSSNISNKSTKSNKQHQNATHPFEMIPQRQQSNSRTSQSKSPPQYSQQFALAQMPQLSQVPQIPPLPMLQLPPLQPLPLQGLQGLDSKQVMALLHQQQMQLQQIHMQQMQQMQQLYLQQMQQLQQLQALQLQGGTMPFLPGAAASQGNRSHSNSVNSNSVASNHQDKVMPVVRMDSNHNQPLMHSHTVNLIFGRNDANNGTGPAGVGNVGNHTHQMQQMQQFQQMQQMQQMQMTRPRQGSNHANPVINANIGSNGSNQSLSSTGSKNNPFAKPKHRSTMPPNMGRPVQVGNVQLTRQSLHSFTQSTMYTHGMLSFSNGSRSQYVDHMLGNAANGAAAVAGPSASVPNMPLAVASGPTVAQV